MEQNGAVEDVFVYSRAVVCEGVSSTLPAAALRMGEPEMVDLEKARSQHEEYIKVRWFVLLPFDMLWLEYLQ